MRNLKRMLCLVLSVLMLVGMMMVGAGAASIDDFADKDEIVNTEAVALMSDLGILEGNPDGKFYPNDYLNRQGLAKIIFLVATRQTDWSMYDSAPTNLTDIDTPDVWAKGAIKYCASVGYITGDGSGKYLPNDPLETVAVAKTLLCALGFDAKRQGYEGDNWVINIMKDAQLMGLMEGVSNTTPRDKITRQDACQMAYNALFVNMREANITTIGETEIFNGYDVKPYTLGLYNHNLVKITATARTTSAFDVTDIVPATKDTDQATVVAALDNIVGAGGAKYTVAADQVGTNVTVYMKTSYKLDSKGENVEYNTSVVSNWVKVSATPVAAATNVIATYNKGGVGLTIADLTTEGNLKFVAKKEASAKIFLNGTETTNTTNINNAIQKPGVIVDFIDNDGNGEANIIKITEKKVDIVEADPVETTSGDKTLVTIKGVQGVTNVDAKTLKNYKDLKKDDVVLISEVGGVRTFEKAAKVTGSVAGNHSTKGALINGEYYLTSGLFGTTYDGAGSPITDPTATYDFYLDNGKNIVIAKKVTDGTAAPENEKGYLAVEEVTLVSKSGDGSFGSPKDQFYIQAKVVKMDGTNHTVVIDSVDGIKVAKFANSSPIANLIAGTDDKTFTTGNSLSAFKTANEGSVAELNGDITNKTYYGIWDKAAAGATADTDKNLGNFFVVTDKEDLVWVDADGDGTADDGDNLAGLIVLGQLYSYEVTSKPDATEIHMVLKNVDNNAPVAKSTVEAGSSTVELNQAVSKIFVNAKTEWLYAVKGADRKVTYTAYKAGEEQTTTEETATISAITKNGVASHVFVAVASTDLPGNSTAVDEYVYIMDVTDVMTTGSGASKVYTMLDVLVNGVKKEIKLDKHPTTGAGAYSPALEDGGLYAVTSVSDKGIYTLAGEETPVTGILANGNGTIVVNASGSAATGYSYADDAPAYIIDGETVTATTVGSVDVDGNDSIVVLATDGVVDAVYVTKVSNAPATVELAAGSATNATVTTTNLVGATDAAVTSWTATNCKVKITLTAVTDPATKITETVTITAPGSTTAAAYTSGDDYSLTAEGTYTVTVTVKDTVSDVETAYVYTFTAPAATA